MKNRIPIYVISLSRTPERRLHIQRQLDALGLKYQFLNADHISSHTLESTEYLDRISKSLDIKESVLKNKYAAIISYLKNCYKNEIYERRKREYLSMLAISLNHIRIYNSMVKNDIAEACILEDDATLLPTFPQVLKAVPKFSWDILLLASQPHINTVRERTRHIRIFGLNILCQQPLKNRIEYLLGEYGFDLVHHPKQSEFIARVVQEYDAKNKAIFPNNRWLSVVKYKQFIIYRALNESFNQLNIYASIRLGAPPEKSSLTAITDYHYIAKPKYKPLSTTAYLVKQSTAVNWKAKLLEPTPLVMDEVPWELHKNEQIKLRLITPPCATATYQYLVYSTRSR